MPIVWDSLLVATTAAALDHRLARARLRAVHLDYEARRLRLHFREATVVFLLHPDELGMRVLEPTDPGSEARPLAATLRGVEAPPDDRVLVFHLRRVRGSPAEAAVVVELMGNYTNAALVEGPERVIRHLLRETGGARPLAVGRSWSAPPPTRREGVEKDPGPDRWRAALDVPPESRRRALLGAFAWTSGLNAPALLAPIDGPDGPEGPEGRDGWARSYERWRALRVLARGEVPPRAVVLDGRRGGQPYPCPLEGVAGEPAPDLLAAFEAAALEGPAPGALLLPRALVAALSEQVERARARVASLEEEAAGLPDPDAVRATGDLLLARFKDVPRGVDEVTLTGFDGAPLVIALDPTATPDANARAYYDRAARAERAAERLPGLIGDARQRWRELDGLLERARAGEADVDTVEAALPARTPAAAGESGGASLPYRRYRSSGGLEVRVGRGARTNDDLTFHHSAPDDIWLHARHAAGAHVILRWQGEGNPPARDLAEAAVLAALASKARTSGSVPVDWTRRKYVRKPRKAPPGAVLPDRVQTLFVEPDPALEERLRVD